MEICNVLQATIMEATKGYVNELGGWEGNCKRQKQPCAGNCAAINHKQMQVQCKSKQVISTANLRLYTNVMSNHTPFTPWVGAR